LTADHLRALALGHEVNVESFTPEGELAHRFNLCATNRTLAALRS
jgi:hypothetical protein